MAFPGANKADMNHMTRVLSELVMACDYTVEGGYMSAVVVEMDPGKYPSGSQPIVDQMSDDLVMVSSTTTVLPIESDPGDFICGVMSIFASSVENVEEEGETAKWAVLLPKDNADRRIRGLRAVGKYRFVSILMLSAEERDAFRSDQIIPDRSGCGLAPFDTVQDALREAKLRAFH